MHRSIRSCPKLRLMTVMGSLLAAPFSLGSDYGTTGLIDVPTARMQQDGYLTIGAAFDGLHRSFAATYQATPWLEATFRYSGTTELRVKRLMECTGIGTTPLKFTLRGDSHFTRPCRRHARCYWHRSSEFRVFCWIQELRSSRRSTGSRMGALGWR